MKFNSLKNSTPKILKVRDFNGGVDYNNFPSSISDNALSDLNNMWHKNGELKTRPGLLASTDTVISSNSSSLWFNYSYSVDDGLFYIDGEYKKIVVENHMFDRSFYFCNIFFISKDGTKTPAGSFEFYRITDNEFYNPTNILFYSACSTYGAGIYALVSAENIYNSSMKTYRIYELDNALNSWTQHTGFYTPVVYINGRGNKYEEAKIDGLAYTGKPLALEAPNMLTNSFKAYFSSDGKSSCFRLPFSNLENTAVICRVYSSSSSYTEWVIQEGQTSQTTNFFTAQITVNIDRSKGILYFTNSDGEYPVPLIDKYRENNIRIITGKVFSDDFSMAASCTCFTSFGKKNIFSGGNDKGKIYSVSVNNPLYFPTDCTETVDGNDSGVTSLLSYKNGILAFKENEIYSISVKTGDAINCNSLLADDDSVFYRKDTFTVKKISANIGCSEKSTCILNGQSPIWLGNDKRIYSMNTSSYEISELTSATRILEKYSKSELENAFAINYNGKYILGFGSKAVIMDYTRKSIKDAPCYLWDFGEIRILGGFESENALRLLCIGSDRCIFYSAELTGATDTDIYFLSGSQSADSLKIRSFITTKHFDFGNMSAKKLIDSILISAASPGEIDISINGKYFDRLRLGANDLDSSCDVFKSIKLIPHLNPTDKLYITLSSDNSFSLGELIIYYRDTIG